MQKLRCRKSVADLGCCPVAMISYGPGIVCSYSPIAYLRPPFYRLALSWKDTSVNCHKMYLALFSCRSRSHARSCRSGKLMRAKATQAEAILACISKLQGEGVNTSNRTSAGGLKWFYMTCVPVQTLYCDGALALQCRSALGKLMNSTAHCTIL